MNKDNELNVDSTRLFNEKISLIIGSNELEVVKGVEAFVNNLNDDINVVSKNQISPTETMIGHLEIFPIYTTNHRDDHQEDKHYISRSN